MKHPVISTLIKEGLDDASEAEIKMGMEGWMDVWMMLYNEKASISTYIVAFMSGVRT